jgi:hypothetical protein
MSSAEGSSVSIEMGDREKIDGVLLCVDPITKMMVIKSSKDSFQLINPAFITNIDGVLATSTADVYSLDGIDMQTLEKRESIAHRNAEEGLASINNNVSIDIQNLFYRLQNM